MEYTFSNKLASLKPSAIREIFKALTNPDIISFAAGNPSPLSFPTEAIADISAKIFKDESVTALQYSITEGYMPLRKAITERNKRVFGIGRDFDTTVVVTGGQQGIELACKALCNEGDAVICENPTFVGGLNAFRSNGVRTVGVPLEADGIDTDALEETVRNTPDAKMIYLIPTFQNPSGITMSAEKRKKVYAIAKKFGIIILEDNPYGELRFAGEDIAPIKRMDEDGIVIYCSSFSKILSAGMRLGYVIAPDAIVQKMVVAKQSEDVHTNIFAQLLCWHYMTEYDMDAHVAGIRKLYAAKCALMLDSLDKSLPDGYTFTRPEGGLFVWLTLPDGVDMNAYVKAAIDRGVAVVPGTTFNCDVNAPSSSVRLNYSTPSDEQIVRGCELLGEAARAMV